MPISVRHIACVSRGKLWPPPWRFRAMTQSLERCCDEAFVFVGHSLVRGGGGNQFDVGWQCGASRTSRLLLLWLLRLRRVLRMFGLLRRLLRVPRSPTTTWVQRLLWLAGLSGVLWLPGLRWHERQSGPAGNTSACARWKCSFSQIRQIGEPQYFASRAGLSQLNDESPGWGRLSVCSSGPILRVCHGRSSSRTAGTTKRVARSQRRTATREPAAQGRT